MLGCLIQKFIMTIQNILKRNALPTVLRDQNYSKQACYSQGKYLERICCIVWDNLVTVLDVRYF